MRGLTLRGRCAWGEPGRPVGPRGFTGLRGVCGARVRGFLGVRGDGEVEYEDDVDAGDEGGDEEDALELLRDLACLNTLRCVRGCRRGESGVHSDPLSSESSSSVSGSSTMHSSSVTSGSGTLDILGVLGRHGSGSGTTAGCTS